MRLLQALLVMVALAAGPVRATELVADLSQHQINISTGFSGTELLLFGAADPSGDVVVIVSGPEGKAIVRKKTRVSGIWINTESVAFDAVPGFYHVSAT
ncbi:MAG: TIGR02186 family protein, partial [Caldilineaceae bacterium]|nr:TIGR02186 family protein [Caldilineaceae bacterium]